MNSHKFQKFNMENSRTQFIVVDINSRPNPLTCVISKKVKKGTTCSASMITKKKLGACKVKDPIKSQKLKLVSKLRKIDLFIVGKLNFFYD